MAYTLRQVVTAGSIIYLLVLTALAAYALHAVHTYSLPIPTVLAAFNLALPALAGFGLEGITTLIRPQPRTRKHIQLAPQWLQITVVVFVIYETAVATLAATHLGPSANLTCALDEQWLAMFRNKMAGPVRRIQDAFQCCGLHTTVDKAWPFPTKGVGVDACAVRFDRSNACLESWRAMEQKVALMMFLVPVLVFVWKVLLLSIPQTRHSWLSRTMHLQLPAEDSEDGGPRRALEYPHYSDNPIVEPDEERNGVARTGRRVDKARESASKSLSALESRVQPSALQEHENEWVDDRHE